MDWRTLFLSHEGRIGQKDFWIGGLILFVIWCLTPFVLHIATPVVWLVLLYPWVCVFAKRLHDFGKSGLFMLLPLIVGCLSVTLGVVFGGVTVISAIWAAMQGGSIGSWAVFFGALGTMLAFVGVAALFKLIFILWVGLSAGDPGPNRYGPPPASLTSRPTPTTA
jgi:uncharacterized membrane protein YhaH (DUF805 family)